MIKVGDTIRFVRLEPTAKDNLTNLIGKTAIVENINNDNIYPYGVRFHCNDRHELLSPYEVEEIEPIVSDAKLHSLLHELTHAQEAISAINDKKKEVEERSRRYNRACGKIYNKPRRIKKMTRNLGTDYRIDRQKQIDMNNQIISQKEKEIKQAEKIISDNKDEIANRVNEVRCNALAVNALDTSKELIEAHITTSDSIEDRLILINKFTHNRHLLCFDDVMELVEKYTTNQGE